MDAGVYLYKCVIDENGKMTWSLTQQSKYLGGNSFPTGAATLSVSGVASGIAGTYTNPDA